MTACIFGTIYSDDKLPLLRRIFGKLGEMQATVFIEPELRALLAEKFSYRPDALELHPDDVARLDMAVSVGGDGAFLRTAAQINCMGVPILGINAGRLGFLADISGDEPEDTLDEIAARRYRVEDRTLLRLCRGSELVEGYNFALNEVAVLKRDTSSMLTIHASIDDDFLATYMADGLIIATPTGSTAYSLSVNGPIIVPQSASLVISPIAPHSLNVRPLVIPDDSVISLVIESRSDFFLVALDGRSEVVPAGSRLTIGKADYKLKVIKRYGQTFYSTLRDKLMWGTDARH
ncbi:MAG: NAD kinase [Tannerellaceae bacterium]|jgi:NAD+ kinase|nr:NAD kinase [Tannerellaceae bacterium]